MQKLATQLLVPTAILFFSLQSVFAADVNSEPMQSMCYASSLSQAKDCQDAQLFYFVPSEQSMATEINFISTTKIMTLFCDFRYNIQFTDYASGLACIYLKKPDTDQEVDRLVAMVNQQIEEAED